MKPLFRHGHLATILVALGLAALMLLGQPVIIIGSLGAIDSAAAAPVAPAGQWNAAALPAIEGVSDAGGTRPPLAGDIVNMRSTGVATSTRPVLRAETESSFNGRRVIFQIRSADDRMVLPRGVSPAITVAQGAAQWTVPQGVLSPFHTYRMVALDAADVRTQIVSSRPLSIDPQRAREQQIWNWGGIRVAKVTGEPALALASPLVTTTSGAIGFEVRFQPSNPSWKGLPPGWVLEPGGSPSRWVSLTLDGGTGNAILRQMDGFSVTFVRSGANGAYVPQMGPHHEWPGGGYADLFRNGDGSFTVTDVNQAVTTFPAPAEGASHAVLHPARAWSEGSPMIQQSWEGGHLALLTDPVSRRSIHLTYGPSTGCAAPAEGFIAPPAGMLCATHDWAGQTMQISYVQTASGPQVGRITTNSQAARDAAVSDIGWTPDGLPARLRQPLAAAAVASGVIPGLGPQDTRAMTQVSYDGTGRVATITGSAGLVSGTRQTDAQQAQVTQSLLYRTSPQGQATFTVTQTDIATPGGIVHQAIANVSTMDETQVVRPDGCRTSTTFNSDDNATEVRNSCDNTRSTTAYDASGQAISARGPTRAPINTAGVPALRTAYDTTSKNRTASRTGRPLEGLMQLTWNNRSFSGVPADRSVGPRVGGVTPRQMVLNFDENPSGAGGDWSSRLSGDYIAPREGDFRFLSQSAGAQMFVNGRSCAPVACTLSLAAGERAHVQASLRADGAAGLVLQVQVPGQGLGPIPVADLSPALLQMTEQWTNDEIALGGAPASLKDMVAYNNQSGGQVIEQTSSQGTKLKYAWRPYTGTDGDYGQMGSWTNPRGKTTTFKYFSATQKASGCGGGTASQGGLFKSQSSPGVSDPAVVTYDSAGRLQSSSSGESQMCVRHDGTGAVTSGTLTGPGQPYSIGSDRMAEGNPLVATATVTASGVTTSATTEMAINGTVHRTTDSHGTVTTTAYDPGTGSPTEITTRTAKGQERTRAYEYDALNRRTAVAIDGVVLERTTYRNDGFPEQVDYANGSAARVELDQNNNVSARTFSGFSGDATVREENTFSRGGSVLGRTLTAPDGTVKFAYAYNKDHRVTLSSTSGTLPVQTRSSTMSFSGPSGANGNRQKEVRVARDGTTDTFGFSYDTGDALTSSTKPGLASIAYGDQRRASHVGETSLAYDSAGNITTMTGPSGRMNFLGNGDTQFQPTTGAAVTLRPSGNLLLDQDGIIAGEMVSLSQGVTVGLDASGQPAKWNYNDLQGSTAWRTVGNDAPGSTTVYDPWGEQIGGPAPQVSATPLDLAMSMQGWAGTTRLPIGNDLYTMGVRQYSPRAGRFVQPDPVGESVNTWEFANGDPLNNRDPSGERITLGQGIALLVVVVLTVAVAILTAPAGGSGGAAVASAATPWATAATAAVKTAATGAALAAVGDATQQLIDKPISKFDPIQTTIRASTAFITSSAGSFGKYLATVKSAVASAAAPALGAASGAAAAVAQPAVAAGLGALLSQSVSVPSNDSSFVSDSFSPLPISASLQADLDLDSQSGAGDIPSRQSSVVSASSLRGSFNQHAGLSAQGGFH